MKKQLSKQKDLLLAGQLFTADGKVYFADTAGGIWCGTPGYVPQPWDFTNGDPEVDDLTNSPTDFQIQATTWLDWITPIVAEHAEEEAAKP